MKKILTITFMILGLALYGQDQKTPYGLSQLTDTTAGTASAETFVLDNKTEANWQVFRVFNPTLLGGDSLKATTQIKEANDYGFAAYASVPGRTMTFAQKATAVPKYVVDTISGIKQEVVITASIDSSASYYYIYSWFRPVKNPVPLKTTFQAWAAKTITDAGTQSWQLTQPLPYNYYVTWYVKAVRASGTAAGNIYVTEAADIGNAAFAITSTTAMTNGATVYYRITAINLGVKQKLVITGSGTQSTACTVYAVVKPLENSKELKTLLNTHAVQTLTDAGTINFVLPYKLESLYDVSYIVKVTKASGTVAGTIYMQEAGDFAGTDYVTSQSVALTDASANYMLNNTAKGVRSRISIVGSGTQSATVIVYAIIKPTN